MTKLAALFSFLVAVLAPTAALAYVGPGAGLSLLGALWALVAAIATALLFIVAWPIRRALRRRRTANAATADKHHGDPASGSPTHKQSR